LKAKNEIDDDFLLLMADHLFEPEMARVLLKQRLAPGEVILAVDPNIDRIFDLDDATKVRRDGNHIIDIGKDITFIWKAGPMMNCAFHRSRKFCPTRLAKTHKDRSL
jgi:choline kinase